MIGAEPMPMPDSSEKEPVPEETTELHTRILRCMLAADDAYAYWRRVDLSVPLASRARQAFEGRWFGMKSEARVRTLLIDMSDRFDAFPETLRLLHALGGVPASIRPFICHVHLQLTDPIYRRFTGELLPTRRAQGFSGIDREVVARWVETLAPGRWSPTSSMKFASNLLATAVDVGLVTGRRDPRALKVPSVPGVVIGYVLYLLRGVRFEGSLTDNLYLRSLGVTPETFRLHAPRVPGIRYAELGGTAELVFTEPSLYAFGLAHLEGVV